MKKIRIKHTDLEVSNLVMGCMRIGELSEKELEELTETYLSEGVNFFDHADIYGNCAGRFICRVSAAFARGFMIFPGITSWNRWMEY